MVRTRSHGLKAAAGRAYDTCTIPRAVAISDSNRCKVTHAAATVIFKGYKATKAVVMSDYNSWKVIFAVGSERLQIGIKPQTL